MDSNIFNLVPCVECAAFSKKTMDGKSMSVGDLRLMGFAMTNHVHTLTTVATRGVLLPKYSQHIGIPIQPTPGGGIKAA